MSTAEYKRQKRREERAARIAAGGPDEGPDVDDGPGDGPDEGPEPGSPPEPAPSGAPASETAEPATPAGPKPPRKTIWKVDRLRQPHPPRPIPNIEAAAQAEASLPSETAERVEPDSTSVSAIVEMMDVIAVVLGGPELSAQERRAWKLLSESTHRRNNWQFLPWGWLFAAVSLPTLGPRIWRASRKALGALRQWRGRGKDGSDRVVSGDQPQA